MFTSVVFNFVLEARALEHKVVPVSPYNLIYHSASTRSTWRDADAIGSHLLDSVAIAVQRCIGMALRASVEQEMVRALGAEAA